ncbi:MAG TPA: hypothetical protein EYH50_02835 [Pyrodictium delaneyi]|uniref:Heavy-metal chelation domain-containing protein n=1 Tax=Pyrodictium delaneyi TaxID=1273541 RepID=A0A832ZTF2_9CREN|nr:hypothetical protein [Pyrodictium delaneyi]
MKTRCSPSPAPADNALARALKDALRAVKKEYPLLDERVEEIAVSRRFTLVKLAGKGIGIAFSGDYEPPPEELILRETTASELARYAWRHPSLTSLALAAVNAATNMLIEKSPKLDGLTHDRDVVEVIDPGLEEAIALVGYIQGVARKLARRAAKIVVYEDNPTHRALAREDGFTVYPGNQLLLDSDNYDIIVATGASLLDPRILLVFSSAKRARLRGFIGPTSSFHIAAARHLGADFIAGISVPSRYRDVVTRLAKAGYGFKRISRFAAKWVWLRQ